MSTGRYSTDEQRGRAGCIGSRMPTCFWDRTLLSLAGSRTPSVERLRSAAQDSHSVNRSMNQ
jgi:hypothetical protein